MAGLRFLCAPEFVQISARERSTNLNNKANMVSKQTIFRIDGLLFVGVLSILSCTEDNIVNLSSGGKFQIINVDTKDTINVKGEGLTSYYGYVSSIQVKVGEYVKLDFIPDEEYKDFKHKVTYQANDGMNMTREGKTFDYEYIIPRTAIGNDTIDMIATCTEDNVISTASGKVVLRVTE